MNKLSISNIVTSVSVGLIMMLAVNSLWAQDTTGNAQQKRGSTSTETRRHVLKPVVVNDNSRPAPTLSQAPVQVADIEKIERTGALLLSDAIKQMAGVTLRDYGGIGGMKTVSARGLGSQFSTLTIDGVAVNDCQNGQVDLGRYMLAGSAFISLTNGQQEGMLLSARATAAGNIINMESQQPNFLPGERSHLNLSMEGGSFGMLSPTLSLQYRLGKKTSLSVWANWLSSNGDYPFTLYYSTSHNDSSSVERRQNSAMWMATADASIFYNPAPGKSLTSKVHYVQGYHQLPGPVTFYAKRGSEETHEKLFFAQSTYKVHKKKASFQLIGKYQHSYDQYEDFRAQTASRYLMNEYSQNEGYLSGTAVWHIGKGFQASIATDGALSTMNSNLAHNNEAQRLTSLTTAAVQYRNRLIDIKANLLATAIGEKTSDKISSQYKKLSPYIGLSLKPFGNGDKQEGAAFYKNIRLRYFFKETYRVPNFNELYYFYIPYDTLHPECALQHNIGLTMPMTMKCTADSLWRRYYSMTIDFYRNSVKDKIIAVPRQNMFLWSTMNLGLVEINGLDIRGNIDWQWGDDETPEDNWSLSLTMTYSYQKALDMTDPGDDKTYGNQIPYTPRHSGGTTAYVKTPWFGIGYSCMMVGPRYYMQQNSNDTKLPAYADQGITIDRTFQLPLVDLKLQAQLLNIGDVQYEVVRSYPMMGRNFRIKASIEF